VYKYIKFFLVVVIRGGSGNQSRPSQGYDIQEEIQLRECLFLFLLHGQLVNCIFFYCTVQFSSGCWRRREEKDEGERERARSLSVASRKIPVETSF